MSQPPFEVEAVGPFGPSQLRIVWHDEARPTTPEIDAMVTQSWQELQRRSSAQGAMLFNGPLVRFLRHRVDQGVLHIDAGPTDYRAFVGTNLLNAARGETLGWERYSHPIGVSVVVVTADGWLLLGRRGQRVAFHAGYVHPIGGMLEPGDRRPDGTVDAFAAIGRELGEELGVTDADRSGLVCLGLTRDPITSQPELVFESACRLDRTELARRLTLPGKTQEHLEAACCRDDPEAVAPFVRSVRPISAVAVASLYLHARRRFGDAASRRCLADLGSPL